MKNIGGSIRALRQEKQMTLPSLAEKADISKGLLSTIETSADANPSLSTLYKIAEALEVPLSDILATEKAQLSRIVPKEPPHWQKGLIAFLASQGKEPDQNILEAMYVMRNRKLGKSNDLEAWKFLYQSIENSFKK
ncbi:MAG TPA: helix-turn-helix transcriptional regulator [Verrucomicrobiae bacterium]|jgi:transcriptional regulator with XRE-family HTH domain|nr:helix-turn-helix transcriptional regulator [Verrucomicrobiae bacterium]